MLRPERRRRADLVAVAIIVVAVVAGVVLVARTGDAAATRDDVAAAPLSPVAPTAPVSPPRGLVEAWRAPSAATTTPVALGGAIVTGDAGAVVGREPGTGRPHWSYSRDLPLCTVDAAFGAVLAVYRRDGAAGSWCSEVSALEASTGRRGVARNSDARPGTRLLAEPTHVTALGRDYLETWRSDLVSTLEYGALPNPVKPAGQPRTGCTYGSAAVSTGQVGVLERCPGEGSDRLTLLRADPPDHDKPEELFSTLLGITGARVVAVSGGRAAVVAPGPPRLVVYDRAGTPVATHPLPLPPGDVAGDPAGVAPESSPVVRKIDGLLLWWTGSATVALDPVDLSPRWVAGGEPARGPAVEVGGELLVPVPGGYLALDPATGARRASVPLDRGGWAGPMGTAATTDGAGALVLEQRGPTVVAVRSGPPQR